MPANLENSAVTTGLEKVVFIPIPKERNAKECSDYRAIALISQASKVMLKILQARLQHYMNWVLPDVQAGFRKGRGTRDHIVNICWITEKQESSRKTSISALLTMSKPLTVWITTNCGKFFKRWKYQTTLLASWEICMQVKKQQLEPDMEQWTGSKLRKEYVKAVYCHLAYLTYMQSASCKMPGWRKHKLESRCWEKHQLTSDMQMTPPLWQKVKRNWRASWKKVKEESQKAGLKLNIQKTKVMTSSPISSWQIEGEKMETVTDFIFLGSKITADGDRSHETQGHLLFGGKAMTNLDSTLKRSYTMTKWALSQGCKDSLISTNLSM